MMRKKIFPAFIAVAMLLLIDPVHSLAGQGGHILSVGLGPLKWIGLGAAGLVVNEATLSALFKSFKTIFNEALSAYQPQWEAGGMKVTSTTSVETYAWMGAFPKMREWIGERFIKNVNAQAYNVANKTFEDTMSLKRTSIEDDQYGVFSPVVKAQAIAAAQLWDDLFFTLLNNGFTGKSYDGLAFFSTTHKSGSNKDSGGGSVLSVTSWEKALAAIRSTTDSQGNPLFAGNEPLTLWVPPALEGTAKRILNAEIVAAASGTASETNIWKGSATPKVSSKLTSATAWMVTVDFMGLKPALIQVREEPEFVQLIDPKTSDHVFMRDEYLYGTRARGNAAYGLHQLAYGSVGA
jgi:phage major head subunit gpT-like protein